MYLIMYESVTTIIALTLLIKNLYNCENYIKKITN